MTRIALRVQARIAGWTALGIRFLEGVPVQEAYAKARDAADHALALSPDLAAAHVARGFLLQKVYFNWRGAEAEYRRAMAPAPDDGVAKFYYGHQLANFGDVESAVALTRQALVTEPLRAEWYWWLATYLSGLGRPDEAEQAMRRAIELQPTAAGYYQQLTIIEVRRGRAQQALAAAQQEPDPNWRDSAIALARQVGDDRSAAPHAAFPH